MVDRDLEDKIATSTVKHFGRNLVKHVASSNTNDDFYYIDSIINILRLANKIKFTPKPHSNALDNH